MIEFIDRIAPWLPAWLPLVMAGVTVAAWLGLAIRYPATVSSRYENAILAVAMGQVFIFYASIIAGDVGLVEHATTAQNVVMSRWVWAWLNLVLIFRAYWAWRRMEKNGTDK